MEERGLGGSVQVVLLLPFVLGLFLATLQWGLHYWAHSTVEAAASSAVDVAVVEDIGAGREEGLEVLGNGSLTRSDVWVSDRGNGITATAEGEALRVVPFIDLRVESTVMAVRDVVTRP